ncbi:MAG: glycosyltransferase family 39 protein [Bacteroidota bacterium]|nr:glycosyltransferase family 39 protein [Bacteroidota bacterium]
MMRATKWLVAVAACGFVALIVLLAYLRLAYPYEVEWMEGAMMDHSMRILDGLPLYSAPTIDFVPWLYPPLYYYIVAGAMKIVGVGFFAGRVVSFGSTLVTAGLLGWIVSRITQRPALALLTFALYLATYHATGFYFDIARNDAFFTLLLVGSAAVAIKLDGLAGASLSGLLLALAFLTKQQAIFFFPALAVWFWIQSKKQSAVFAVIAVGLTVLVLWMWNHA